MSLWLPRQRLSGPLRDRFDLALEIPAVPWGGLRRLEPNESSREVRGRVVACRKRQVDRQNCVNAHLKGSVLKDVCRLDRDPAAEAILGKGVARFQLSAGGVTRVLRVSRTIADLQGRSEINAADMAEALQFRLPDSVA